MKAFKKFLLKSVIFSSLFLSAMFSSTIAQAQQAPDWQERFPFIQDGYFVYYLVFGFLLLVTVLILLVCIYILYCLKVIMAPPKEEVKSLATENKAVVAHESFWVKLNKRFGSGNLLPVEKENEIMMDHAYDGITELDNHMPPWIKYTFYATIIFAVVYVLNYLVVGTGTLQIEEYNQELAEAEASAQSRQDLAANDLNESNVTLISDATALEGAKAIFIQNCAACHGKDGGGTVGPNLTDEYWLHGGDVKDVFKIIKYGVQEKGMIPWDGKLKPEEIQGVASYILSLQGTVPENPKEPQGEKFAGQDSQKDVLSLK